MIPFILIFTVPTNDELEQKKLEIADKLEKEVAFSESDSIKYKEAIHIFNKIRNVNLKIDSLENTTDIDKPKLIITLKRLKTEYKKDLDKEIKDANPQIKDSTYANVVYTSWVLFSLIAFIHSFIIIKKYRQILNGEIDISKKKKVITKKEAPKSKHEDLLNNVSEVQQRILSKIKKSKEFDSYIVEEIKEYTDKYTNQIKKLIIQEEKLFIRIKDINTTVLTKELEKLKKNLTKEENPRIELELKNAIDSKQTLLDSYIEIITTHKTVSLRLQTAVSSLKQVENDLIKLENVFNPENKEEFFKSFDKKSEELNNYVSDVEKNYKNM